MSAKKDQSRKGSLTPDKEDAMERDAERQAQEAMNPPEEVVAAMERDAERQAQEAMNPPDEVVAAMESADPVRVQEAVDKEKQFQAFEASASRPEIVKQTWAALVDDYGFGALTLTAALDRITAQPATWLVRDIVTDGTYGVLAGIKGIGKTVAMIDLAVSVALGEPWLGRFECRRARALVLTCEDSEAETWRRAVAIAVSRRRDPEELDGWLYVHPEPVAMTTPKNMALLAEELERVGSDRLGLVVLDPAYKYLAGSDARDLFAMPFPLLTSNTSRGPWILTARSRGPC